MLMTSGFFPIFQTVQRLAEEAFRRFGVPCRREIEINRVSMLVERPVQIGPFAANLHASLIDPPTKSIAGDATASAAASPLQARTFEPSDKSWNDRRSRRARPSSAQDRDS